MMEKVCKLYEEEQTGKTSEGRKVVPNSKMPDLAWDIAETQLNTRSPKRKQLKYNTTLTNISHGNHSDNSHCETDSNTNLENCKKCSASDRKYDQGSKSQQCNQKQQRFPQSYNISDNNNDQYNRPHQSQKTSPNKQ